LDGSGGRGEYSNIELIGNIESTEFLKDYKNEKIWGVKL
jgi:hypothetical protein